MMDTEYNIKLLMTVLEIPEEKTDYVIEQIGGENLTEEMMYSIILQVLSDLIERKIWNKYFRILGNMNKHDIIL